jgi:hypothetical protein
VDRAEKLGDHPTLVELNGVGHFELIDPDSDPWSMVARSVLPVFGLR